MSCNDKTRPKTSARLRWVDFHVDSSEGLREAWTYDKDDKNVRAFKCSYDSVYNFVDEMIEDSPFNVKRGERTNYRTSFRRTADFASREHLLEMLKKGHTTKKAWDLYSNAKSKLVASPEHISKMGLLGGDTRRKRQEDLGGYLVNIDKVMVGLDPIESIKRNAKQKSVRVFIDYSQSASVPPSRIWETTTNAIAICEVLDKKGYATEIAFGHCGAYRDGYETRDMKFEDRKNAKDVFGVVKFVGKHSGERINESALMNYAVGGVFRDLLFEHLEQCLGIGGRLGQPLHYKMPPSENLDFYKSLCDCDVYIGKESSYVDIASNVVGQIRD